MLEQDYTIQAIRATLKAYDPTKATREELAECHSRCLTGIENHLNPLPGTDRPLSFGDAVAALKAGKRVARKGWNGKGMWLALQTCDENSKMGHSYIYMSDVAGKLFPWNPNNLDMLAEDWGILD